MSRHHRGEADHGTQMRHIIIKQGYLKKLANSARLASTIRVSGPSNSLAYFFKIDFCLDICVHIHVGFLGRLVISRCF